MLLLLRFFYVFTFFQNPKKRDFLRFLPCFIRFLELCLRVLQTRVTYDHFWPAHSYWIHQHVYLTVQWLSDSVFARTLSCIIKKPTCFHFWSSTSIKVTFYLRQVSEVNGGDLRVRSISFGMSVCVCASDRWELNANSSKTVKATDFKFDKHVSRVSPAMTR